MYDPTRSSRQLVTTAEAALPAIPSWNPPANLWLDNQQEAEGFNFQKFLHSLRRTWLFGTLAGLLVAATVAGLLWFLVPETYEAYALVRVRLAEKELLDNNRNFMVNPQEYAIYKESQAVMVRSSYVITKAVRPDEIRQLSILQNLGEQPETYLERVLDVSFPNRAEIMKVALRGSEPEEMKTVVNAIVKEYLEETRTGVNSDRARTLDALRAKYRENQALIQEHEDQIYKLSVEIGAGDSQNLQARWRIAEDDLRGIARRREEIQKKLEMLQTEIVLLTRAQQLNAVNPSPHMIADQLEQDPIYMDLKRAMDTLDMQMKMTQGAARSGSAAQMRDQATMDDLAKRRKAREAELIPRIKLRISGAYGADENFQMTELRRKRVEFEMAQVQFKNINEEYSRQMEAIQNLQGFNATLMTKQSDLENLKEANTEIHKRIAQEELALQNTDRVSLVAHAEVPQDAERLLRLLSIVAASLASFGLTLFGIALSDYLRKIMSSANELEREANVSVLGKLPSTSAKSNGLFGGQRVTEALMADYVDSIRAAITRGDKAQDIDSVVVTSAVGKEGKSTLASQLAVSFARSGKRTLLVDGDIRNPRQHLVFGVPMDRGLCDLLLGNSSIADAVQVTPADNLWILPAGHYDVNTLHGVSGTVVGDIMEQLRAQYDFVIVDAAPVLTSPESMIVGQYVSGAVLACRHDHSSLEKVDEAQRRLRSTGIRILGAVINGAFAESRQTQLALPSH